MSAHTKEPWEQCSNIVRSERFEDGSGGFLIAECPANTPNSVSNARRIFACVNACAGIDTDYLESPDNLATYARKMAVQRDELLAALKVAVETVQDDRDCLFDCHRNPSTGTVDDDLGIQGLAEYDVVIKQARSAIAKAEASQ